MGQYNLDKEHGIEELKEVENAHEPQQINQAQLVSAAQNA